VTIDPGPAARALAAGQEGLAFAVEHGTEGFRTTPGFPRDFPSRFLDIASMPEIVARPTARLVARMESSVPTETSFEIYGIEAQAARELCAAVLDPEVHGLDRRDGPRRDEGDRRGDAGRGPGRGPLRSPRGR
jgi:hypothetical protein